MLTHENVLSNIEATLLRVEPAAIGV